ncbi:MAG: YIP1 family protein [Pelagimonas sp.]|uniref:YIP1 family protein n=1 Tax=Pelagimonas sp. TaxID=2073170 RepID=UPI003D6A9C98
MGQMALTLVLRSITEPRLVARWLLGLKLSREALLICFALVVVLNTLLFGVAVLMDPAPLPWFLAQPSVYGILQAGSLVATIFAFLWGGRLFSGTAQVADIAILVIWMQTLRVLVQVVLLVLMPVSAFIGGLAVSLSSVIGFWILLHFIDEAHGFGSLLKALGTIVFGLMGMAFAISILLTLIGVDPTGINGNV